MKTCEFPGCDRPFDAKGLCSGHNKQRYEGRELRPLIYKAQGDWTIEKLLKSTKVDGECRLRGRAYSKVRHNGEHELAHRLMYMLYTGEDITGMTIHHTCANARCINPEHLQLASRAENTLEMLGRRDYEARIAVLEERVAYLESLLDIEQVA